VGYGAPVTALASMIMLLVLVRPGTTRRIKPSRLDPIPGLLKLNNRVEPAPPEREAAFCRARARLFRIGHLGADTAGQPGGCDSLASKIAAVVGELFRKGPWKCGV